MTSTPSTPRTPRQRLQLRRDSDVPPIPPRLRGSEMLWNLRLKPTIQSHASSPSDANAKQWFDDDEFSTQGPQVVLSPVSTATIHRQSTSRASLQHPSFVTPPVTQRTRSFSSPPVFEPNPPPEFPFPKQIPQVVELAMEDPDDTTHAKKPNKLQKSKK